ncbi:MAG: hypothetical protein RRY12_13170 [Cloacibacillus sp.]
MSGDEESLDILNYMKNVDVHEYVALKNRTPLSKLIDSASKEPMSGVVELSANITGTGLRDCRMHYGSYADDDGIICHLVVTQVSL